MKFNKLYVDWIKYLKQRELYEDYRKAYASVSYYIHQRDIALVDGSYWNRTELHRIGVLKTIIQHSDPLIRDKDDVDFYRLRAAMSNIDYNLSFYSQPTVYNKLRKVVWVTIVEDFGELKGLYKRPTYNNPFCDSATTTWTSGEDGNSWTISMDWGDDDVTPVRHTIRSNAESRYNRAHEGQWYDRFNGANNRRRNNNFNQNIRWRRR